MKAATSSAEFKRSEPCSAGNGIKQRLYFFKTSLFKARLIAKVAKLHIASLGLLLVHLQQQKSDAQISPSVLWFMNNHLILDIQDVTFTI